MVERRKEETIYRYGKPYSYDECGCTDEYSNGNGSLMRILPLCSYVYETVKKGEIAEEKGVELLDEVSAK